MKKYCAPAATRTTRRHLNSWKAAALLGAAVAFAGSAATRAAQIDSVWSGGSTGTWETAGNWNPSVVPTNGADTYVVQITNGGTSATVTMNASHTIDDLVLDAGSVLDIANGQALTFATNATITGNGNIVLNYNTGGNVTQINFDGNLLSGSGGLNLAASGNLSQLTGTFTQDTNHTITGLGNIVGAFTNNGTVIANANGSALTLTTSAMTNNKTFEALNGGILNISGITVTQGAAGQIIASGFNGANLSTVNLTGNTTIIGGTLSTAGGGVIRNSGGTNTLQGLTNSGAFEIAGGTTTDITGDLVDNGLIIVNYNTGGGVTGLSFDGGTLSGTGTITLNNSANLAQLNGSLTQSSDHTIKGQGQINAALTNNGIVNANVSGGTLTLQTNAMTNNNLFEATAPALAASVGTLTISGITVTQGTNGVILADGTDSVTGTNHSTVNLINGAAISGGTLSSSGGGVFFASNASLANLTNAAAFNIVNGTSVTLIGAIKNTGTINMNDSGSGTQLLIDAGGVMLTGGGTINLGLQPTAAANNRIGGTGTLTNVDNTIQGYNNNTWTLGNNSIGIVNETGGTINANAAGTSLWVDPNSASGLTNTGTMEATNGGNLNLTGNLGGAFDNTGGTILATGSGLVGVNTVNSAVSLINNVAITGGTLSSTGNAAFFSASGALANLTNAATFNVNNGGRATLIGAIKNTGTINVNDSGTGTELLIDSNGVTLTGGGTINLGVQPVNNVNNAIGNTGPGTGTLTNVDNTIQGYNNSSWSVGDNNLNIVNQSGGTIDANTAGQPLWVDPSSDMGMVNAGTMKATGGGNLMLTGNGGGAFDNTGGTILATGSGLVSSATVNSAVSLTSNVAISGGTLSSTGNAAFFAASGSLANLTNAATLNVNNGARVTLIGAIKNTGTINVNDSGSATEVFIDSNGVTLTGGGTINLGVQPTGSTNNAIGNTGAGIGTLTNVDNTIQGYNNSSWSVGDNNLNLVNQAAGTIDATTAGQQLWVDPSSDKGMVNAGTMEATGGGNLVLTGSGGGAFDNTGGTISATGSGLVSSATVNSAVSLTNSVAIRGGTLSSTGNAAFFADSLSSIANLTNAATINENNGARFTLIGAIKNTGTINVNDSGGGTELFIDSNGVTLTGGGTIHLGVQPTGGINNAIGSTSGTTTAFTNVDNTIQGYNTSNWTFGDNNLNIVNQAAGTIAANTSGQTLWIDPSTVSGMVNAGTVEATGGGTLMLTGNGGGSFTNNGTFAALDASTFTNTNGAVLTNLVGSTLTGGIYQVIDGGNGAAMALPGGSIATIAVNTTVILSGAGSTFTSGGTGIETSLTTNNGSLEILAGRNFTTTNALTNNGTTLLGGGTLTSQSFINGAAGLLKGFGAVDVRPTNHGVIESNGGTLTFNNGILGGSGTIQIDPDSVMNLSGGSSGSSADYLIHNGNTANSLILGLNNLDVAVSYTNANFGVGNGFNKYANVLISGGFHIRALGDNVQVLTGDLANGDQLNPVMDFGNVHVTTSSAQVYQINNIADSGPAMLYALQTSVNGGNLTDARLSGTGVTASNIGPVDSGIGAGPGHASAALNVVFTPTTDGTLVGQTVHVANNFDGNTLGTLGALAEQTLTITGAGWNFAAPVVVSPVPVAGTATIDFGNLHEGAAPQSANFTIKNNAPADGFSEKLDAGLTGASGNISLTGAINLLDPQASDSSNITASFNPTTAGAKSGTAALNFTSDGQAAGTAGNSGLGQTALNTVNLAAFANVFRFAVPVLTPAPVAGISTLDLGNFHETGADVTGSFTLNNNVANDGFSEKLDAAVSGASGNITIAGNVSLLAPGATDSSSLAASFTRGAGSAGAKSGTATLLLTSDGQAPGTPGNSGLGTTGLTPITLQANANVFRFAAPVVTPAPVAGTSTINFGKFREGAAPQSANFAMQNSAANDGFSEKLDTTLTGVSGNINFSGAINLLNPGATDSSSINASFTPTSAGAKSGTATLNFISDGQAAGTPGNSGLGQTGVGSLNLVATATVYRLATVNTLVTPINLGIIHPNDSFSTQALATSNTAVNDGFSEGLDGSVTGSTAGAISSGSVVNLAAGNASGVGNQIVVGLGNANTSTAGAKFGTVTVGFSSDGATTSGFTAIPITGPTASQIVTLNGQVNDYASPAFHKTAGDGTLSNDNTQATSYTLDFGTQTALATDSATLSLENLLVAADPSFQDSLGGHFTVTGAGTFQLAGFSDISDSAAIAPNASLGGLSVSFANLDAGSYSETITFTPNSTTDGLSPDAAIPGDASVALNITLQVNPSGVPEPGSLALLGLGAAALLKRRRRS